MTVENEEIVLEGLALSPGIIIGKVWLIDNKKAKAVKRRISRNEVEREIKRLHKAVSDSKTQLIKIKDKYKQFEERNRAKLPELSVQLICDWIKQYINKNLPSPYHLPPPQF